METDLTYTFPSEDGRENPKPGGKPMSTWENNEVQFARLIEELVATDAIDGRVWDGLQESMSLESDDLSVLFERARETWEAAKADFELPEGLRLDDNGCIVDAQEHVWVAFYDPAPGDPDLWRRAIVRRVTEALGITKRASC